MGKKREIQCPPPAELPSPEKIDVEAILAGVKAGDIDIICVLGPTASGKTRYAVSLARQFAALGMEAEIISADSRQVYRGMDIGTGKDLIEYGEIPYHLIDIVPAGTRYSLFDYQRDFEKAYTDIKGRGKLPIIVGGTGFYIKSLLYTKDEGDPGKDPEFKQKLRERADKEGLSVLYEELGSVDEGACARINRNDRARIIRALEYNHATGSRYSEYCDSVSSDEPRYDAGFFVLECERSILYARMDQRIDRMIADGLVDEVRGLIAKGVDRHCTSMNGIGYKEILSYLDGDISLDEAVRQIKSNTHHYAVRQSTWFRHQKGAHIIDCSDAERATDEIYRIISSS